MKQKTLKDMKKAILQNKALNLMLFFFLISSSFITVTNSVSAQDTIEDTWNTKTSMNQPRHDMGIVTVDGKIYAIGGATLTLGSSTQNVGTNEQYDPKTDKWITLKPMPTPRSSFAIVASQGMIYCIGNGPTEVYDIATNNWSTKSTPPFNKAIQAHAVDEKILVIVSYYEATITHYDLYMYDSINDSWTAKASVPEEPLAISSFVMNNQLMVAGTFKSSKEPLSYKVLTYNPTSDKWSDEKTLSEMLLPHTAGVTSGVYAPQKVYIFSTLSTNSNPTLTRCYDFTSDSWTIGKGVPTSRSFPSVAAVDDVFYVIGGLNQGVSLAVNEQYVPFGYHGTLSSNTGFSLNSTVAIIIVTLAVSIAVGSLVVYFRKRK